MNAQNSMSAGTLPNKKAKHILVIEDAIDIQQLLADLLELEGYEVSKASNGQQAIEGLRSENLPDLIILDLMMPVMDGYQFRIQQLADDRISNIPVIVMSATRDLANISQRITATDYLSKPVDLTDLLKTIESHCPSDQY